MASMGSTIVSGAGAERPRQRRDASGRIRCFTRAASRSSKALRSNDDVRDDGDAESSSKGAVGDVAMSRDGGARSARTDRRSWSRSMPSMFDSHPTTSSPLAPKASSLMITSEKFSSKTFWDSFWPRSFRNRSAGASWPIVARRFVSGGALCPPLVDGDDALLFLAHEALRHGLEAPRRHGGSAGCPLLGLVPPARAAAALGCPLRLLGLVSTARAGESVLHRRPAVPADRFATYGGQPVRTAP